MEKKKVAILNNRDKIIDFLQTKLIAVKLLKNKAKGDPKAPENISLYLDGVTMACMELLFCMGEYVPKEYHDILSESIELVLVASGSNGIDKLIN